jgi:HD domain-containing protein
VTGPSRPAPELVPGFVPENELECSVSRDPALLEGLAWGKPRKGHPEGSVGNHVADLLATIEAREEPGRRRSELRLLALLHDSFKYRVRNWLPKIGENHHAMRARRFAERYTGDERLLAAIELHDRPYAIWRRMRRTGRLDEAASERMLARITDPPLFLRFVELDGSTGGKSAEPVRWLRQELRARELV